MHGTNSIRRFTRFLGDRGSLLFLAVVAFTSYEVVMRYAFNSPTVWVHEMSIALSAAAFIVAGAYTLERGEHIRITLVYQRVPPRLRSVLDALNAGLSAFFLGALAYGATGQALKSIAVGETTGTASRLPIPVTLKTLLALGTLLMLLVVVIRLRPTGRGED